MIGICSTVGSVSMKLNQFQFQFLQILGDQDVCFRKSENLP
jgi:hypothetical protein